MKRSPIRLSATRALVLLCALIACDEGPPEGRVATLSTTAGDQQQAVVGAPLAQPLVVRAVDVEGKPVRGARVEWQVAAGGGSIASVSLETDADGRATANWTLGTTAGEQAVIASIGIVTTTFRATARPGPAATVTVTPASAVLDAIGASTTLQFGARDAHGNTISGRTAQWSSTADAVATVDAAGLVTARSPGTARVRATLDGASGEAQVTVAPQPASITVTPPAVQLSALGATAQFSAAAFDRNGNAVAVPAAQYVWSSSNAAVVSVSTTGLAMAQGNGSAQVRAALGTVVGQALVQVQQFVTTLVVMPRADTLTTDRPATQLTVIARDANGQVILTPTLVWSSSNAAVAIVSPTGQVSAIANGEAVIRVASGTAVDSVRITVRLNTRPGVVADSIAAVKDTPLAVAAPGVLRNDTLGIPPGSVVSFGGGNLGGTVTSNPAGTNVAFGTGGMLQVNADGSLAFTPSAGFTGSFTVNYRAGNVAGTSDGTITFLVGEAPAAVDDAYSTTVNTTLTVNEPGLLANDMLGFPPGVIVSFGGGSLIGDAGAIPANSTVGFGVGGFLRVNSDGSMTITPPTGFTGVITFLYRLSNGAGSSDATVTITVTPPPLP